MSSAYAVAGQMVIAASNYVVFVILARLLDSEDFLGFSTAVGLNMFALAIAEGGLSFVAPRLLAGEAAPRRAGIAAAFVAMSAVLYCTATVGGWALWNGLAPDDLSLVWTAAYAAYVLPSLVLPAWITCWALDLSGVAYLFAMRAAMVVAILEWPLPSTIAIAGGSFALFAAWLLWRLNRHEPVIGRPLRADLVRAVRELSHVFLPKTASYAAYGLAPMAVAIARGGAVASMYVTGERLKSLYATLFQPLVQTAYLSQFRAPRSRTRWIAAGLHLVNVVLCLALVGGLSDVGVLGLLGSRFEAVPDVGLYLVAAAFSVAASVQLHLTVLARGDYRGFQRATGAQVVAFVTMFVLLRVWPDLPVVWTLALAEGVLLGVLLLRGQAAPERLGLQREA